MIETIGWLGIIVILLVLLLAVLVGGVVFLIVRSSRTDLPPRHARNPR